MSVGNDSLPGAWKPEAVSVREKWREVQTVSHPDALDRFANETVATLRRDVAPLMQ